MSYPNRFLVEISYLGFRYHGVQIQPGYLTVAHRFEELLNAHFPEQYQADDIEPEFRKIIVRHSITRNSCE